MFGEDLFEEVELKVRLKDEEKPGRHCIKSGAARGTACAKALRQKRKKELWVFEELEEVSCAWKARERMEGETRKEARSQITQGHTGRGKESGFHFIRNEEILHTNLV